jgi:formylglycine-generating enzyme required for sulfatase activity
MAATAPKHMIATSLILATILAQSTPQAGAREAFVQQIPNTLVSFKMLPVPDGEIAYGEGKKLQVKNLFVAETETLWDVYDVWYLAQEMSDRDREERVDGTSRPSRPYGDVTRGFGHTGFPAIGMTQHAAMEFCKWLSQQTGRKYRLPHEFEWQYVAQAGSTEMPNLEDVAWFNGNVRRGTRAAKSKKPNAWGVYDTLGNASEWTVGAEGEQMTRGGSWRDAAEIVNFTSRVPYSPRWQERDAQIPKSQWWLSDGPFVGFRVVCEG